LPPSSEHSGAEQETNLLQIVLPIRNSGKKASRTMMEETILALCETDWLTLRTLARLLDRKSDYLRNHYIARMLKDGRLQAKMPGIPNHPGQAYRKQGDHPESQTDTDLTQSATKLSESTFSKIWDNPEDTAYDDL
jgi:hypothetical protein